MGNTSNRVRDRSYLPSFLYESKLFRVATPILILLALLWIGRYWQFTDFGLYEDDLTKIPAAIQMDAPGLFISVGTYIRNLYGQGRPLHHSFIRILSWVGWRIGGLRTVYVIGFIVVASNIVAFYLLVRRISGDGVAFAAGVFFSLYSADTTQAYLTHSLGLFPAMLLMLFAMHAFLSGKKLVSYICIALAILTYETVFFVFLVAPLLNDRHWDRKTAINLGKHILAVLAIFITVFALRTGIQGDRVTEIPRSALILTPIRHMIVGPIVSVTSYLLRSFQVITSSSSSELTQLILSLPVFSAFALRAYLRSASKGSTSKAFGKIRNVSAQRTTENRFVRYWRKLSDNDKYLVRLILSALVMIVLAYPLTFTTRSYSIMGRDTRVHFAAAPGVALLWGTITFWLLIQRRSEIIRWITVAGIAIVIPLMIIFGFQIQRDYVTAWDRQQIFWEQLLPLIEDSSEGDVILVNPSVFRDTEQIDANTWNLPRVLPQLLQFPDEWEHPPRVYRLVPGWESHLVTVNGSFDLYNLTVTAPPSLYRQVAPANTIFVSRDSSGALDRQEAIEIDGREYLVKQQSKPILSSLPRAFLAAIMDLKFDG